MQLYVPGGWWDEIFNKVFDTESSKYTYFPKKDKPSEITIGEKIGLRKRKDERGMHCKNAEDDIVFMRVLCRKHVNFCASKMWEKRILPAAEVYFINEEDKIELIDMDNRHRSGPGIESFLRANQLLEESKNNPDSLVERAGTKYL